MEKHLKDMHDMLVALQPPGVEHACGFCATPITENANLTGGNVSEEKTYTEGEYSALKDQVSTLEARVAELSQAAEDATIDSRITEAKAELEARISDLQSQLDTATLESQAAKTELDAVKAWLEGEAEAAVQAAEAAARMDERVQRVKDVANFPEEYLTASAERFAAMSEEAFELALEDWKTIAPKQENSEELPPAETAMLGTRSTNNNSDKALIRGVLSLREQGVDVRTI